MSERMRSPFSVVAQNPEFVSLLGTIEDKDGGTSTVLTFADVVIASGESIFVAVGENAFDGIGIGATDNLGNTYTVEQYLAPGLCVGVLLAAIPSITGTINTITVSQTNGAYVGIVAARFRNIGASIASTQETNSGADYSVPNTVLTQAANGIGISCYAVRTTGTVGFSPGTLVGTASTSGGADSSNVDMGMSYVSPVTASGITGILFGDPTRAWVHVGKTYAGA